MKKICLRVSNEFWIQLTTIALKFGLSLEKLTTKLIEEGLGRARDKAESMKLLKQLVPNPMFVELENWK